MSNVNLINQKNNDQIQDSKYSCKYNNYLFLLLCHCYLSFLVELFISYVSNDEKVKKDKEGKLTIFSNKKKKRKILLNGRQMEMCHVRHVIINER